MVATAWQVVSKVARLTIRAIPCVEWIHFGTKLVLWESCSFHNIFIIILIIIFSRAKPFDIALILQRRILFSRNTWITTFLVIIRNLLIV